MFIIYILGIKQFHIRLYKRSIVIHVASSSCNECEWMVPCIGKWDE